MSRNYTRASWVAMMARCYDENHRAFRWYGAKGIRVAASWHNFDAFVEDMGQRPADAWLDRRDNGGDYGPGNCRWASVREQANNRTNNHRITAFGEQKTLADWARDQRCVVRYDTLKRRVRTGWDPVEAITTGAMSPDEIGRIGCDVRYGRAPRRIMRKMEAAS